MFTPSMLNMKKKLPLSSKMREEELSFEASHLSASLTRHLTLFTQLYRLASEEADKMIKTLNSQALYSHPIQGIGQPRPQASILII